MEIMIEMIQVGPEDGQYVLTVEGFNDTLSTLGDSFDNPSSAQGIHNHSCKSITIPLPSSTKLPHSILKRPGDVTGSGSDTTKRVRFNLAPATTMTPATLALANMPSNQEHRYERTRKSLD